MHKKILTYSLLLLLVVTAFSCKKSDSSTDPGYYIKFKKNGTWVTWTGAQGEVGPDGFDASRVDLGVVGQNASGTERIDLTLQKVGTSFNAGNYDSDVNSVVTTSMSYFILGNTAQHYDIEDNTSAHSRYTVTITSITPTAIEGNFTGNFLYDSFDDISLNITEGQFRVQRVR